jgi:hypothetical protein
MTSLNCMHMRPLGRVAPMTALMTSLNCMHMHRVAPPAGCAPPPRSAPASS